MNKLLIRLTFPFIALIAIYALGPEPDAPVWDMKPVVVPESPDALEQYIAGQEAKHKIKPDNEARIVWADSARTKTPYSVVYLHGFSASQEEGDPVHETFAKTFGCNLYLARMADHGIDTVDQLLYFTPDRWWQSSKEALAIGKAIGDKVILMSTSTGGTMALILADAYPEDVFAMINMSPNIAINDDNAWLLDKPWGLQLARLTLGGKSRVSPQDTLRPDRWKYWNQSYRLESVTQLQELVTDKMNAETFSKVKCPTLTLYYYKNDKEQDPVVKVSAMMEMHRLLGTPDSLKMMVPIPNAGGHVLGSHIVSKDIESVNKAAYDFAVNKLHLTPAPSAIDP